MVGTGSTESWSDLHTRGEKAYAAGDFSESAKLFQAAADAAAHDRGEDSVALATCLLGLAKAYVAEWDYGNAEMAYQRALSIVGNPHAAAGPLLLACL